jgi:hypothetical protein
VACDKIDEYYEKTTNTSAYIMAMDRCCGASFVDVISNVHVVLNPKEKMSHFKKHWSEELQDDVLTCLKEVVRLLHTIAVIVSVTSSSLRGGIYNKTRM